MAIKTESSQGDATIPAGTFLAPGEHYLIADSGWNSLNQGVIASYEESMTLVNSDGGVALVSNGMVLDALGWGDPSGIDNGLYEGSPSALTEEGFSLRRKKASGLYIDTQNNSADFYPSRPNFKRSSGSEILVFAEVLSSAPAFEWVNVSDEDPLSPGIQVLPMPGKDRLIGIKAAIRNSALNVSVNFDSKSFVMNKTGDLNSTTSIYEANISMPFYFPSGNHTIGFYAYDLYGNRESRSQDIEILGLLSVELDTDKLYFSSAPGTSAEIKGDYNLGSTGRVTIRNTGNKHANFEISGTDLAYGGSYIGSGNISFTFGDEYSGPLSGKLSLVKHRVNVNLTPGQDSLQHLSFRLDLPGTSLPGNYTGSIFVSASG